MTTDDELLALAEDARETTILPMHAHCEDCGLIVRVKTDGNGNLHARHDCTQDPFPGDKGWIRREANDD